MQARGGSALCYRCIVTTSIPGSRTGSGGATDNAGYLDCLHGPSHENALVVGDFNF